MEITVFESQFFKAVIHHSSAKLNRNSSVEPQLLKIGQTHLMWIKKTLVKKLTDGSEDKSHCVKFFPFNITLQQANPLFRVTISFG